MKLAQHLLFVCGESDAHAHCISLRMHTAGCQSNEPGELYMEFTRTLKRQSLFFLVIWCQRVCDLQ